MSTLVSSPTPCDPKCQWTEWFDEDYPTPEAEGGDNETYAGIEAAGTTICEKHEKVSNIECMAEGYPRVPLADLEQEVLCELSSGLVCKNRDQKGPFKKCLNYMIRVECCQVSSNCQPPTRSDVTVSTSPSPFTQPPIEIVLTGFTSKPQPTPTGIQTQTSWKSTGIPETSTLSLATTSKSTLTFRTEESKASAATTLTTAQCFCMMNDTRHNPGEVLYRYTDDVGCGIYVICGEDCRDQRYIASCPQSCDHLDPPREINEVWVINNCAQGICLENNTIRIDTVTCPSVEYITCENDLLPKQVFSDQGCCFHYECESCTGPDGKPKTPGMTWTFNCQLCTCDAETITVNCTPIECVEPAPPICDQEGFELVETQTPDNPCCTTILCRCNFMNCRNTSETCPAGFKSVVNHVEGVCCPTFTCEPDQVCVFNETTYQPGWSIQLPKSSCEECTCTSAKDAETQLNQIMCIEMSCDTQCPLGHEYQEQEDQCCGECLQVACIVKLGRTTHTVQPEHKWSPPGMPCVTYQCSKDNTEHFVLITENRTCPVYRPENCSAEDLTEIRYDACCKLYVCAQVASCKAYKKTARIHQGDCWTTAELSYCEGSCSSLSMFSTMKGAMERTCTCCQELRTSKKKVQLDCPDGRRIDYTYITVEECGCRGAVCIEQ